MKGVKRRSLLLAGGGSATVLAVGSSPSVAVANHRPVRDPAVVLAWNRTLLRIVRTPGAQPATVHPTRSFAIMHAAVHNAVVATGGGRPYLFEVNSPRGASPVAAASQAAHDVLVALYPTQRDELDGQLATELATVRDRGSRAGGVRVGALTARLLLGLRVDDRSTATPPAVPPGTAPGQYRPTPPAFAPPVFTHWSAVTPFVLDRADRFRSAPFPPLTGAAYAAASNEVQSLGRDSSATRSADQTIQGTFWAGPIWNTWNEIAQTLVSARHADLATAARVFAHLNLAFADAVIAFYDAKYHHGIWRPITAIRLADTDGNPATAPDPGWTPLATTPPDPTYPGAHSVVAQTGAVILGAAFGPAQRFTVSSVTLPGVTRNFSHLQQAADEAGISRIFAGVHTRLDHDSGQRLGGAVGRFTLSGLTD